MNYKRIFGIAVSFLLTIVFLYLAFKKVDINMMYSSLKHVKLPYIILSVSLFFMSLSVRSLLWKKIFGVNNEIMLSSLFRPIVIGQMGNNILPFRAGELLRIYSLSRKEKISKSLCFSTVMVERLFDFVSLAILASFVSYFIKIPIFLKVGLIIICSAAVFTLAMMIYIANHPQIADLIFDWLSKILPLRIKEKLSKSLRQLLIGLEALNSLKTIGLIFFLSFICWGLICSSYFFALKAYNLNFAWILPLFLLVLLNIGMIIPTVSASLGFYQFFSIVALTYFGIEKSIALGFSFMLQAVDFIPSTFLGLLFFSKDNISLKAILANKS